MFYPIPKCLRPRFNFLEDIETEAEAAAEAEWRKTSKDIVRFLKEREAYFNPRSGFKCHLW
jgi:hypothetical protein